VVTVATSFYVKDPNALLDYDVDWNKPGDAWLLSGDTIVSSTFTVVDTGIVLGTGGFAPSFTTTKTKVWVSGGSLGQEHRVVNHVVTAQGREEDHTLVFLIAQK
jgi:hypothetical protein